MHLKKVVWYIGTRFLIASENNENITNKSKSSEPISPNLSKQTASKQAVHYLKSL